MHSAFNLTASRSGIACKKPGKYVFRGSLSAYNRWLSAKLVARPYYKHSSSWHLEEPCSSYLHLIWVHRSWFSMTFYPKWHFPFAFYLRHLIDSTARSMYKAWGICACDSRPSNLSSQDVLPTSHRLGYHCFHLYHGISRKVFCDSDWREKVSRT